MPRWAWFLPVVLLGCWAASLGWRQGWDYATRSETAAIEAAAARYLADRSASGTEAGADVSQCRARPADRAAAWLVVVCGPEPHDPARHYTYYIDRFGRLARVVGPGDV